MSATHQEKMKKLEEQKKMQMVLQSYHRDHSSPKKYDRICSCGTYLEFLTDEEKQKSKLNKANFCEVRLCPMCQMRKARKEAFKISTVMDAIEAEEKKSFIFLTFTAPNVPADMLSEEITKYNKAFHYLVNKVPDVAKVNHGYLRKLEVSYNPMRNDFHPHIHVMMAVEPWYFKNRLYIKKQKWLDLWRKVMKDDSITQVDVERAYRSDSGNGAFEIAKYIAKSEDYGHSQDVFDVYHNALQGRRMITTNGLFKTYFKKYKDKELEKYMDKDETYYKYLVVYRWKAGAYDQYKAITLEEAGIGAETEAGAEAGSGAGTEVQN